MSKHIEDGFTLFELLISLVIVAILVSLAIFGFQQYFRYQEVQNSQQLILQTIQFARSKAMQQSHHVVICASSDQSSCTTQGWQQGFIVFTDKNNNRQFDHHDVLLAAHRFDLRYANLSWASLNTQRLSFVPNNGRPLGSNGSFHYCSNQSKFNYAIAISNVGNTRVHQSPSC